MAYGCDLVQAVIVLEINVLEETAYLVRSTCVLT